jgi:hypothetical protein
MSTKARLQAVSLLHKEMRYRVYVYSIPAVGHLLRVLLKDESEPRMFQVRKVVFNIAVDGRTKMVELHLWHTKKQFSPADFPISFFQTDFSWKSRDSLPSIWDSVRLDYIVSTKQFDLKVRNVLHEIDQAEKIHTINVQVIDTTPKRVFSDEMIKRAHSNDVEPLFEILNVSTPDD